MSENTGSNQRLNKTSALKKTQARQWFEVVTITKESSLDLLDHTKCPAMQGAVLHNEELLTALNAKWYNWFLK